MNKKIILLYPYYNKISGAYNRYLFLEKLVKKTNFEVKLIILKEITYSSNLAKFFHKFLKFIKVELIIFFYSCLGNHYFISDFNPSIIAIFSKNVFIQIHDVSWDNKLLMRHNFLFYKIFKFFIKYYSNILTVSKTSMNAINEVSQRKKRTFYLYNSVSQEFINESNNININEKSNILKISSKEINLNFPSILYIATLVPRKCHLDLLEALAKSKRFFNVNLVGLPINKDIFEFIKIKKTQNNYIESNINYFPELSQKDLCKLLIFSSAYVSTSISEGFGIPVLEAQLYNLPLLIRDININRELFPNAKFFKSINQLSKLLKNIKILTKTQIKERKEIVSKLDQDNITEPFNYLTLSKNFKSIIQDLT